MKKLIPAALALAALVGTAMPTFAQSYDPGIGTGNIMPGPKGGMESGTSSRSLYNYAPMAGVHDHSIYQGRER